MKHEGKSPIINQHQHQPSNHVAEMPPTMQTMTVVVFPCGMEPLLSIDFRIIEWMYDFRKDLDRLQNLLSFATRTVINRWILLMATNTHMR